MYVDKKIRRWPWAVLALLLLLGAAGLLRMTLPRSGQDMEEESIAALKAAVERSARQCYVVEGFYPPSLEYLEENYGLQINMDEFVVVYDVFASNISPDVRVVKR